MIRKAFLVISLVLAVLVPLAFAASADTLDDLLAETQKARAAEAEENKKREAEFLASRDRQKALLDDAQAKWNAAKARSDNLSTQFDANEVTLADLETKLKSREGNLGELFGVTRQVAGDSSAIMYNSLTSAQFRGRDEFFTKLAKSKVLPTIPEFEQLAFELLREITETGRVARWKTEITTADGEKEITDVVRIGGFIAMAGERYLDYNPKLGTFSVFARQPPQSELIEAASGLTSATSGYHEAFVDPSRGVLLSIYTQRPSVWERVENGEKINYVILLVGIIGLVVSVYQFFYLIVVRRKVAHQLQHLDRPMRDNPLGRVLATFRGDPTTIEEDVEVVELRISEAVLKEVPKVERFQAFLRLAVAAGPLLGLVGTVVGMIITFQSITESGSSDPKLMAHGIGAAMMATVLGLGIAIPLLFINAALSTMSRGVVQVLDEQSNGLLAEHIERKTGRHGDRMPDVMDLLIAPYRIVADMIELGGFWVIFIFLSGLLLWTLVIERYWYFSRVLPREAETYLARLAGAHRPHFVVCAFGPPDADLEAQRGNVGEPDPDEDARAARAAARTGRHGVRHAQGVRVDGAARIGRRAHDGERRLRGDDLHADRPRGEHHRPVPGLLLQPPHAPRDRAARGSLRVLR